MPTIETHGIDPAIDPTIEPTNDGRRQILLGQHAHLRQTIQVAQTAARNVLAARAPAGELKAAVVVLQRELLAHLADEERLLEPILAKIDAWGPIRAELLRTEHTHQRAILAVLAGPAASPAVSPVAGRTLALCDDLITDMEFEERELMNEMLLRDDLILIDAGDD